MTDKVRVGIIGVGRMGALHLQKFLQMGHVEVVGIYEPSQIRALALKDEYGVIPFESIDDLLFESDGVVVSAPTADHFEIASKAARHGVHALLEKPICETVEQAQSLVDQFRGAKKHLHIGLLERFRLKGLTRDLPLGAPRYIEASRLTPTMSREPGIDVVSDLMIHDLDLVRSLIPLSPMTVSAVGTPVITSQLDIGNARLEFPDGSIANLNVSRISQRPERKFKIFSTNSFVSIDFIANAVDVYFRTDDGEVVHQLSEAVDLDPLSEQAHCFIESISGNQPPLITGVDGLVALRTSQLIKNIMLESLVRHAKTIERTPAFQWHTQDSDAYWAERVGTLTQS